MNAYIWSTSADSHWSKKILSLLHLKDYVTFSEWTDSDNIIEPAIGLQDGEI